MARCGYSLREFCDVCWVLPRFERSGAITAPVVISQNHRKAKFRTSRCLLPDGTDLRTRFISYRRMKMRNCGCLLCPSEHECLDKGLHRERITTHQNNGGKHEDNQYLSV